MPIRRPVRQLDFRREFAVLVRGGHDPPTHGEDAGLDPEGGDDFLQLRIRAPGHRDVGMTSTRLVDSRSSLYTAMSDIAALRTVEIMSVRSRPSRSWRQTAWIS